MALPSIQATDSGAILPISKIAISGTQSNLIAHMHFELTFRNEFGVPVPITYFSAPKTPYELRNVTIEVNGVSVSSVAGQDRQVSFSNNDSIETALLEREPQPVGRLGVLGKGELCKLGFECVIHSRVQLSDTYETVVKLESISGGKTAELRNFFCEDCQASGSFQVMTTSPIEDVRCNCQGVVYNPLSASSGELRISGVPEESVLEITMVMKSQQLSLSRSRPQSSEKFRIFSFAPLLSQEVAEKLMAAQRETDSKEKLCLLAQAAHGFQLNNEQIIKRELQMYPKYDGDVLGMPENVGTELVSTIQPASWIENDHESVYSPYEGDFVHNFVNMWDGRRQKRQLIHTFVTSIPAIAGLCMILLSAILWGIFRFKGLGGLLALSVVFYIASSLYVYLGRGFPIGRRVNARLKKVTKSILIDLESHLLPGMVDTQNTPTQTAGVLWKQLFYEPGFQLTRDFIAELARNPEHVVLQEPRVFRSLMLVNRYVLPMVFAFGEPEKVNQMYTIIKSMRNVLANALIQGCEEIKESVEDMIIDALLPEEVRFTKPINLRHFTMDVPEIIALYKSVASTIAGRNGERGEEADE